mgnify:CR=1 FL=1
MQNDRYLQSEPPRAPKNRRRVVLTIFELLLSVTVVFSVYQVFVVRFDFLPLFWVYYALTFSLALFYILYNRGLAFRKITRDMLSPNMSESEKDAFLRDVSERKRKSRVVLILLFGFIFTFAFDFVDLFIPDYLRVVKDTISSWFN